METGGAACNERRCILTTTADTFREINTQAAEARWALDNKGDRSTMLGHLRAIQMLAQNGLREAIESTPLIPAEACNDLGSSAANATK